MASSKPALGIDLGTTKCCVGIIKNGQIEIILNDDDEKFTSSKVCFGNDCANVYVGKEAEEFECKHLHQSIYDIKRIIGRSFSDKYVRENAKRWPFKVVNVNDRPTIEVNRNDSLETYSLEDVCSILLRNIKTYAEDRYGGPIDDAVISVPACFNNSQRKATRAAAEKAGFNVLRILNEPTAAAIAYAWETGSKNDKRNIFVYDLGGGTFDASVVQAEDKSFRVKNTKGDAHLGGIDFDYMLFDFVRKDFEAEHKCRLRSDMKTERRLLKACTETKHNLSSLTRCSFDLDRLDHTNHLGYKREITRAQFEWLCSDLFAKTISIVEDCLKGAGMKKEDITDVVLVGGSAKIPKIKKLLEDFFQKQQLLQQFSIANASVAYGATLVAANLQQDSELFKIKLTEIASFTIGIRNKERKVVPQIKKNASIPCRIVKQWCVNEAKLVETFINIYQGESEKCEENHYLGNIKISLPPRADNLYWNVILSINEDGILHVEVTGDAMKDLSGCVNINSRIT